MTVQVRDRVILTHGDQVFTGTVTTRKPSGMCTVKWDTGMTELIHESEFRLLSEGAPEPYPPDDPKSDGYHDRMADIWDARG